jgi:hypothetical protein
MQTMLQSLRVDSPRLAACAVIPANAGIQKPGWMSPAYHTPGQAFKSGMTQNTPLLAAG